MCAHRVAFEHVGADLLLERRLQRALAAHVETQRQEHFVTLVLVVALLTATHSSAQQGMT